MNILIFYVYSIFVWFILIFMHNIHTLTIICQIFNFFTYNLKIILHFTYFLCYNKKAQTFFNFKK